MKITTDVFYDEVKCTPSGVLFISIPYKLAQFSGIKKGDQLKVLIQKQSLSQNDTVAGDK